MKLGAGQGEHQPCAQQAGITGCQRGEQIGEREAAHGDSQEVPSLQLSRQYGHDRSANGIGEGEASDQLAGGGQTHTEVPCQHWQQPSDHEAFSTNGESAELNQIRRASDPGIATFHSAGSSDTPSPGLHSRRQSQLRRRDLISPRPRASPLASSHSRKLQQCYSESGKGDAAIKSQALGVL
jgi:hypothetical protein